MEKKLVAIKLHFGEPGNLTYLRPNYAKAVADVVKEAGRRSLSDGLQHPLPGGGGKMPWSTLRAL